jgi:hypothetical protein
METAVQTPFGAELVLPDGYNEVSINWGAGTGVGQLLVSLNLERAVDRFLAGLYSWFAWKFLRVGSSPLR